MEFNKQALLYAILKIMEESKEPIGSGYIRDNLLHKGFEISEATAGRILRSLDLKGYTEKVGFRGRILTELGKRELEELEHESKINHYGQELLNVINVTGKKELLDILIARKAIESQLAKLAAINITDDEIQEMKKIIESQHKHVVSGMSIAEDDVKFHKAIAVAAKNRVLDAALDLIRQKGQLAPIFEYIRKEVKSTMLSDHQEIYEAICSRNPESAEKAMIKHIENIERDVNRYWELIYKNTENKS